MNPKLRQTRRNLFANKKHLEIADRFDKELVEDLVASAPELTSLVITVLDGDILDTTGISDLEHLEVVQIVEGADLQTILLTDLGHLKHLRELNIDICENAQIGEIDLTVLAGNESLEKIRIDCPVSLLRLDGLSSCSNLASVQISGMTGSPIDLSALSGCPKLSSIEIMYFGRDAWEDIDVFEIRLPQDIPLDSLSIAGFLEGQEPAIDFTVLRTQSHIEMLSLLNIGLTSFDLTLLEHAERLGQIDLLDNELTEVDITPILGKPMCIYHGIAFSIDSDVKVIIRSTREKVQELIRRPDEKVITQTKHGPSENMFGYSWLQYVLDNHIIEWK